MTKINRVEQAWESVVSSQQTHVQLGKKLQATGLQFLNKIEGDNTLSLEEISKYMSLANSLINQGVKIESTALFNLLSLKKEKPEKDGVVMFPIKK